MHHMRGRGSRLYARVFIVGTVIRELIMDDHRRSCSTLQTARVQGGARVHMDGPLGFRSGPPCCCQGVPGHPSVEGGMLSTVVSHGLPL